MLALKKFLSFFVMTENFAFINGDLADISFVLNCELNGKANGLFQFYLRPFFCVSKTSCCI